MALVQSFEAKTHFQILLQRVQELLADWSNTDASEIAQGQLLSAAERECAELPIVRLADSFELSALEVDLLVLSFACADSPELMRQVALIGGHPERACLSAVAAERLLLAREEPRDALKNALATGSRLRSCRLLATRVAQVGAIGLPEALLLEDRIVDYLYGSVELDLYSRRYLRDPDEHEPAFFEPAARERMLAFAQDSRAARANEFLYLCGPEGCGLEAAANQLAQDCGRGLVVLRTDEFVQLQPDWARGVFKTAVREARLLQRSLFIPEIEMILESAVAGVLRGGLAELVSERIPTPPVILAGEGAVDAKQFSPTGQCFVIELAVPTAQRRVEIWSELLPEHQTLGDDITLAELANRYRFTPGQIRSALNFAYYESLARGGSAQLSRADLMTGCRMSSNRKLTELASRIEHRFGWDDLVLSANLSDQVRGVVRAYRQIHEFYEGWQFADRFRYGQGVSALFGGASGTGKTMAASVIANELDLELYKIDLSRVISKFIGETEKNLARIFKEAETSNAILFFDEADALFGKRSEVKDAHDRHANIEINYLLQQMEEYSGLTILATNLSQNIDDAFTRRLQFIINFTKPKVAERERIWRGMFPAAAPVSDDVDFALLAQSVELAGGSIKNIIFNAGMMALEEKTPICMRHLVRGVRMEYLKENIPFIAANFGSHGQA